MVNMSYCRFENTYNALKECINHIKDGVETSQNEIHYAEKLYKACEDFLYEADYNGMTDENGDIVEFEK